MVGTVRSVSVDKPITAADVEENFDVDKKPFYELRAFLEYQRFRKPFKSLLITSFGSDAGKSTVASNLAANYALGGSSVVLMDSNFTHADQHLRFNVKNNQGLTDLLFRNLAFGRKFLQTTKIKKLAVLPVGSYQVDSLQLIDPAKAQQVINAVEGDENLVIIDGPSLTDFNTRLFAASVDRILIVMREGTYSMDGLEEILNDLKGDREKILGVVMNEQGAAEEVVRNEIDQRKSVFPENLSHWAKKAKNLFTKEMTKKEETPEHLRRVEITDPHVSSNENILKAFEKANRKAIKKSKVADIVTDPINTSLETGHPVEVDPGLSLQHARVQDAVEVVPDSPEKPESNEEFAEVIPDQPEMPANKEQFIEVVPDPPKKVVGKKPKTKAPTSVKIIPDQQKNNGKKPKKSTGVDTAALPPKPNTPSKKTALKTDVLQIPLEIDEVASQSRKSGTLKKNTNATNVKAKDKVKLVTEPVQKTARKPKTKKITP
jgi:protein-tyrosine kinase